MATEKLIIVSFVHVDKQSSGNCKNVRKSIARNHGTAWPRTKRWSWKELKPEGKTQQPSHERNRHAWQLYRKS